MQPLKDGNKDPNVIELSKLKVLCAFGLLLMLVPNGLSEAITVPELALLETESMQHAISFKPLMSPRPGGELVIWSILKVDSLEIGRHLALDFGDLIGVLVAHRGKIAIQCCVATRVTSYLPVQIVCDWSEEHVQGHLTDRVNNRAA